MQANSGESVAASGVTALIWRAVNDLKTGFAEMLPLLAAGLVILLSFWGIAG